MTRRVSEPTYKRFITGPVQRFDERNTAYSRGDRGEIPSLREAFERGLKTKGEKNIPGFTREDYALLMAGRAIDTLVRRAAFSRDSLPARWPIPVEPTPIPDPAQMSQKVKKVATWFGAALVGICELNHLWIYSHWGEHNAKLSQMAEPGDPLEIPEQYRYAVVVAVEMDYDDVRRSPAVAPSVDLGYSEMAFVATSVAEFIRFLGYHAIPSGNDTALSIPLAVDAGLGELGRNGLLITQEYGPRVRLCKVFTDLPLKADGPIDIGVQDLCEKCDKCARYCPGQAIMKEERTDQPRNRCNNSGVLKWPLDAERCVEWWYRNGTGCTNCIRVCPWNKPPTRLHRTFGQLVAHSGLVRSFSVWLDDALGYGKQVLRETP
jgi:epoxyqueuosine reductase